MRGSVWVAYTGLFDLLRGSATTSVEHGGLYWMRQPEFFTFTGSCSRGVRGGERRSFNHTFTSVRARQIFQCSHNQSNFAFLLFHGPVGRFNMALRGALFATLNARGVTLLHTILLVLLFVFVPRAVLLACGGYLGCGTAVVAFRASLGGGAYGVLAGT